jgi:hypothetical protein
MAVIRSARERIIMGYRTGDIALDRECIEAQDVFEIEF